MCAQFLDEKKKNATKTCDATNTYVEKLKL